MISYEPLFRTMKEKHISSYELAKRGFPRSTYYAILRNGVFPVLLIMPLNRAKALLPTQSISCVIYCIAMFPILWNILMTLRMCINNNCLIVHFLQVSTPIYLSAVFLVCSHYNFLNFLSKLSRCSNITFFYML